MYNRADCDVTLGPCERHDCIHFTCPSCGAEHDRGYVDGVDTFRCLGCGYRGHGFNPDSDTDRGIGQDIREAQAWDMAHGLPAGPFHP